MKPLAVLEIPGLSRGMVERWAPRLKALGAIGTLQSETPALTLPAHASLMTGTSAHEHGVVANGWYQRDRNEVLMWPQGEGLVKGEKIWEAGNKRDPAFTCFKHFWWPGMGSTADVHVNVRPAYFADGKKAGDVYSNVSGLREELQDRFGTFPLFKFWGPGVGIESTQWIAATAAWAVEQHDPTLSMIYLPHLDYHQQTLGPNAPEIATEVAALDQVAGDLIDRLQRLGREVVVLSSYTMNEVAGPVHLNKLLREAGWLKVMKNPTGELIDFGQSRAFAVCDHQIANVYVREGKEEVLAFLRSIDGVASVEPGVHANQGEFVVEAERDRWFSYYYWLDDAAAPDFARTVAIHAKPGYDPCEMIFDPALSAPKARIAAKLLRKKLGFRTVMDFIPLDASLIKGSHGVANSDPDAAPVCIGLGGGESLPVTSVKDRLLDLMF